MVPGVIGCLTGRFQLAWLHVVYLLIGNPPLPVLWGRKLQCSLLHLNKYIKKRRKNWGFHSNWHLSNGGDELEGIRLENDIFPHWSRVHTQLQRVLSYRHLLVSTRALLSDHRLLPAFSSDISGSGFNEYLHPHPASLLPFHTRLVFTSATKCHDAVFAWNSEERRYDGSMQYWEIS